MHYIVLACRELGRLICEVGMLVTKACDKYVAAKYPSFNKGRLLQSIQNSSCHKVCLFSCMASCPILSQDTPVLEYACIMMCS